MNVTSDATNISATPVIPGAQSLTPDRPLVSVDAGDGAQFRAALERRLKMSDEDAGATEAGGEKSSLGQKMLNRAVELSGEMQAGHQHVSALLEKATRTGDSMQLMKAMMALSDYQLRVHFVSKTISKATSSIDQLTRLQ